MTYNEREIHRLHTIYRGYAENPAFAAKWDPDNLGNQWIVKEREQRLLILLRRHDFWPLDDLHVLDVGCGTGGMLFKMQSWGARPENLVGIDLLPERVEQARRLYPHIRFICGDAAEMNLPSNSFDLILTFTLFSSILDMQMAKAVANRIWGVLKPGGAVVWYDFRYNNPGNPNVRGVKKSMILHLFPNAIPHLQLITLAPPLARRLGRLTPVLYPLLSCIPFLRTHYLGLLIKPGKRLMA